MTNSIGFANPSGAGASTLALEIIRMKRSEVNGAKRMIAKHVPEHDEHRVLDMLGLDHA